MVGSKRQPTSPSLGDGSNSPSNPSAARLATARGTRLRVGPRIPTAVTAAPPSSTPPTSDPPSAQLDASLSLGTMQSLLQPPVGGLRPPLSWSARQAREQRRRDMLQLFRWVQVEVERVRAACARTPPGANPMSSNDASKTPAVSATFLADLSSSLRSGQEALDQSVSKLMRHVASGTSGGDDLAAEILLEIWNTQQTLSSRQQWALQMEVRIARKRADDALRDVEKLRNVVEDVSVETRVDGGAVVEHQEEQEQQDNFYIDTDEQRRHREMEEDPHVGESQAMDALEATTTANNSTVLLAEAHAENVRLQKALEAASRELTFMAQRTAALEAAARAGIEAEDRAECAERQLLAAEQRLGQLTPRPSPEYQELRSLLGDDKAEAAIAAVRAHAGLHPSEVAAWLLSAPLAAPQITLPCEGDVAIVSPAHGVVGAMEGVRNQALANNGIASAVADSKNAETLEPDNTSNQKPEARTSVGNIPADAHASPSQTTLDTVVDGSHHPAPMDEQAVGVATTDNTSIRRPLDEPTGPMAPYLGKLHGSAIDVATLADALSRVCGSTAQQYKALEAAVASLAIDRQTLRTELSSYKEAERQREAARRRREEEAQLEKKNVVQQYLDLLSTQGEDAWKDQLIGMGQGSDVPKLFRYGGKVRNKHLSKRDTEKLVKEIWKERLLDPAVSAGKSGELVDFVGTHLQKKVGIAAAVIELGYNFLYGLWLYQWDADCELFLKILAGEIREEVYIAQSRLQEELEELFAALDKAKGQANGFIPKTDFRTALFSFFRVGQPGGKSLASFDELMQALEEDQAGPNVEWKKVFEEDREFNQGEFAEATRDQFLQERIEFFKALETALYEESGNSEDCTREQVVHAILFIDPDCTEKAANSAASGAFGPGIDTLSVKAVMKKLSRGILRGIPIGGLMQRTSSLGGRNSSISVRASIARGNTRASHAMSAAAGGKGGLLAAAKRPPSEAINRALEAVRQEWIRTHTAQSGENNKPGNGG